MTGVPDLLSTVGFRGSGLMLGAYGLGLKIRDSVAQYRGLSNYHYFFLGGWGGEGFLMIIMVYKSNYHKPQNLILFITGVRSRVHPQQGFQDVCFSVRGLEGDILTCYS